MYGGRKGDVENGEKFQQDINFVNYQTHRCIFTAK